MIVRCFPRLIWAAALLVAAVLALVPAPASAHAGHVHAGHAHSRTVDAHRVTPPAAPVAKATSVQNVSAAETWSVPSADDSRCDDAGCCASGPCTGCHGAVLTSSAFQPPVLALDPLTAADSLPPGDADASRLKRPPKFFA